ncbi:MAG: hypothetical protein ACKVP5_24265 [Aestuariivirga sp.]
MYQYTDAGPMMWGMGWVGALFVALLILCVAVFAKYLFFGKRQ